MPWMFGNPVQLSNCPFQVGEITHKKKKVDEMSLATKERMRIERERVIKEYRNLKKKNFPLWSTTFDVEYKKSKILLLFLLPLLSYILKSGGNFFIYIPKFDPNRASCTRDVCRYYKGLWMHKIQQSMQYQLWSTVLGRVAIGDQNRMLRHSLRREVIFSKQHFIAPALDLMPCTILHMSYKLRRLVKLTDEDDRKLGLNMTETDEPYLSKILTC